jgi:hypothetical protein
MNRSQTFLLAALVTAGAWQSTQAAGVTSVSALLAYTAVTAEQDIRDRIQRRRPGHPPPKRREAPEIDPDRIEPVSSKNIDDYYVPVPDRWRIMESLGIAQNWWDPYNQNTYKADKPLFDDWFLNVLAISDTVIEPRSIPTPVGPQLTTNPGEIDIFGSDDQLIFAETMIFGLVYYKGNTVFRPPDYEYRITLAAQYNRVQVDECRFLNIDGRIDCETREDFHIGLQELFMDKHLRNVSTRFDFDSLRFGIQPFSTDFRGFLYQDLQPGLRLFGNRDSNKWQYNLAWFRKMEKDTNSGLNDVGKGLRDDDIFIANVTRQDWPRLGFFTQGTIVHNRNREDGVFFDENGFISRPSSLGVERPHQYDVTYFGLNGDGHFGPWNLTTSAYLAVGEYEPGVFVNEKTDIEAAFFAAEVGRDFDWVRLRLSALYATGDEDPFDDKSNGFDTIFENPIFAGADTSYWIRQTVPLIGGGGVFLTSRNSLLPSMRSSREQGQSNFENPGLKLLGIGADFDITPETRISFNLNQLWFDDTSVIEVARNQGSVDKNIGLDASVAVIWRPFMTQNVIVRLSAAGLLPGQGMKDLFPDEDHYSVLANIIFAF